MDKSEGSSVDPVEFEQRSDKILSSPTSDLGKSLSSLDLDHDFGQDLSSSLERPDQDQLASSGLLSPSGQGNSSQRQARSLQEPSRSSQEEVSLAKGQLTFYQRQAHSFMDNQDDLKHSQGSSRNKSQRDNRPLSPSNSSNTNTRKFIAQHPPEEAADAPNQRLGGVTSPGSSSTPGPPSSRDIPPPQTTGSGSGACGGAQSQQVDSDGRKISIEQDSSLNSNMPKFDAVIICHEDDREMAVEIKNKLNKLILCDGTAAIVATEDDNVSFGTLEVDDFDAWLRAAQIMFLLINERFCRGLKFKAGVAIGDSLIFSGPKKEYVIPIFLENKEKIVNIQPSLRQIKGINYFDIAWEGIEYKFRAILDKARKERKGEKP